MGRQRLNPALQYGRRHDHRQEAAELPPPVGDDPAFVMLVKTDNAGTSGTNQMTLPLTGSYTIDWGDGVVEDLSGAQTHTYPAPGEYTIKITGGLTRIAFVGSGDRNKLLDIQNWGNIAWTTMNGAFRGCTNLTGTATDAPDLSSVTDMSLMFFQAAVFNMDIGGWDMSAIAILNGMLSSATVFNQDIGGWNVSNVTNMSQVLRNAKAFNQNIGGWNTSKVTDMSFMFDGAPAFDQDISGWDVSKVTNMSSLFRNATAFNQDIGGWNVGNVTDMSNMLWGSAFNQDIGGWNVGNVTNMSSILNIVTLSPANYGALLIGWAAQTLKSNLSFSGGFSKYPTDGTGDPLTDAAAARAKIIADFGWTIQDGGPA